MAKNKLPVSKTDQQGNIITTVFYQKNKPGTRDIQAKRNVAMYEKDATRYYLLHTSSKTEYLDGQAMLIKNGFFYDVNKNFAKEASMLYQKRNISISAFSEIKDEVPEYTFALEQKELPDISNVRYAEDLLQFTSHEFLVSFFGKYNVDKDKYYFSEKELRKCSVLFGGSNQQVVFVWKDEANLKNIEYILVSTIIPTEISSKSNKMLNTNEWSLRNGIHHGTNLRDLLKINENDFKIYGNPSGLAFMIEPTNNGNIDFQKTAFLLTCKGCNTDILFDKPLISALDIVKRELPVSVFDMIIYPDVAEENVAGVLKK